MRSPTDDKTMSTPLLRCGYIYDPHTICHQGEAIKDIFNMY